MKPRPVLLFRREGVPFTLVGLRQLKFLSVVPRYQISTATWLSRALSSEKMIPNFLNGGPPHELADKRSIDMDIIARFERLGNVFSSSCRGNDEQ